MKKFRFLSLLVVLALVLSACGGGAPAAEQPAAEAPAAEAQATEAPKEEAAAAAEAGEGEDEVGDDAGLVVDRGEEGDEGDEEVLGHLGVPVRCLRAFIRSCTPRTRPPRSLRTPARKKTNKP